MAITVTMIHPLISNGRGTAAQAVVRSRAVHASLLDASNAYNMNGGSGQVNNYNNKSNSNLVRAVVALDNEEKEGWIDAYFDCLRNKLRAKQCNEYRIDYETDLWKLVWEVHNRTYHPSEAFCFIVTRPRLREIFAAAFRDRIVQHWIMLRVEPLLERRFRLQGDVSFNCRKGYGTLKAVNTAREHIERISEHYTREAWIGKIDIAGFFMSIDKDIMLDLLLPFIRENYMGNDLDTLLWLTEVTVRHQPQLLCERRTPMWMWDGLPANKSLFTMPDGKGMAIGNITSQQLANFYLSGFDDFILEECSYCGAAYVRFVDDALIVANDKRFIVELRLKAMQWLKKHLKLTLHKDKFYLQPASHGVKFVGCVIKPGRTYTANRTMGNMAMRIAKTNELCRQIVLHGPTRENLKLLKRQVISLNSYMGFCVHNCSYNLRKKIFSAVPYFWKCCNIQGRFSIVKVKHKYNYESFLIKTDQHETEQRNVSPSRDRAKGSVPKRIHGQCAHRRNVRRTGGNRKR